MFVFMMLELTGYTATNRYPENGSRAAPVLFRGRRGRGAHSFLFGLGDFFCHENKTGTKD